MSDNLVIEVKKTATTEALVEAFRAFDPEVCASMDDQHIYLRAPHDCEAVASLIESEMVSKIAASTLPFLLVDVVEIDHQYGDKVKRQLISTQYKPSIQDGLMVVEGIHGDGYMIPVDKIYNVTINKAAKRALDPNTTLTTVYPEPPQEAEPQNDQ